MEKHSDLSLLCKIVDLKSVASDDHIIWLRDILTILHAKK